MSSLNNFPSGMRVLVVDDDAPTLKVVSTMLQKCSYQVTSATSGKEALSLLRDKRQAQFDLVLSDVMMPDMDGFRLLELIGLELDLPVIMMSSNGETHTVLRGVTHGAVDFLIKPVRLEELRNMWQHVVRRRRDLVKEESEDHSGEKEEAAAELTGKKRKEHAAMSAQEQQDEDASASKKARVVWSVEMHQQFVNAVNQLGVDKAVPKKILEIMQVDGLTRENVASHLQKYRLYLKRVSTHPGAAGPSGQGGMVTANGSAGGATGAAAAAGPAGLTSQPSGSLSARAGKGAANGHAANAAAAGLPGTSGASPGVDTSGAAAPGSTPSPSPDPAAAAAAAAGMAGVNPLAGGSPLGAAGFPGPLLNPMANPMGAPLLNPTAGLNPLLAGMNPLNMNMGLIPGMGQSPMQIPGLPLGGMPMGLPFMPGMGMPGMMPGPGMMPPVPGLNLPAAQHQAAPLGTASASNTPRQGSGPLALPGQRQQQLMAQQQQQQQQLQQQQQQMQQQQPGSGGSSGGSACTQLGLSPGQLGMQPYPIAGPASGSPSPALGPGMAVGGGLGGSRQSSLAMPGLPPGQGPLPQHALGVGGASVGMVGSCSIPGGSSGGPGPLDDIFDHTELAAAFNELYNGGEEDIAAAGPGSELGGLQPLGGMQMPMMLGPSGGMLGGSCAAQASGMGGGGSDPLMMLPKPDPDDMQLEVKGGLAMGMGMGVGMGLGPEPGPEAMDDLINFFLKG